MQIKNVMGATGVALGCALLIITPAQANGGDSHPTGTPTQTAPTSGEPTLIPPTSTTASPTRTTTPTAVPIPTNTRFPIPTRTRTTTPTAVPIPTNTRFPTPTRTPQYPPSTPTAVPIPSSSFSATRKPRISATNNEAELPRTGTSPILPLAGFGLIITGIGALCVRGRRA